MENTLKKRLMSFIVHNVGKDVLLALDDNIRSAYEQANDDAKKLVNINPSRMRAQNRRYYVDNAVAGIHASVKAKICSTEPKGEMYVVLKSGKITLSHIELHKDSTARDAKHRKLLAKKNAILEKPQYDLFKQAPPELDDALHIVIVVIHPEKRNRNQGVPLSVLVTVPYTTWDGYHLEVSLIEMLEKYSSEELEESSMIDGAWPKLREDLKKKENSSGKAG